MEYILFGEVIPQVVFDLLESSLPKDLQANEPVLTVYGANAGSIRSRIDGANAESMRSRIDGASYQILNDKEIICEFLLIIQQRLPGTEQLPSGLCLRTFEGNSSVVPWEGLPEGIIAYEILHHTYQGDFAHLSIQELLVAIKNLIKKI